MKEITTQRPKNKSKRVRIVIEGEARTEQSHKDDVNINSIVRRYQRTGLFPQRTKQATYGDFTGTTDYHEAQNRLIDAKKDFMSLPSDIRKRFKNDAGQLLSFINDPENREEAIEIGLIPKPVLPEMPPEGTPEAPIETEKEVVKTEKTE